MTLRISLWLLKSHLESILDDILKATERYVESFHGNYSLMRILPYFVEKEGNSELLTFLEVDTSTGGEYMNIQQMI